jgi:hypothetical protein
MTIQMMKNYHLRRTMHKAEGQMIKISKLLMDKSLPVLNICFLSIHLIKINMYHTSTNWAMHLEEVFRKATTMNPQEALKARNWKRRRPNDETNK